MDDALVLHTFANPELYSSMMQGLDLSPYFLAVAAQKEEKMSRQHPIRWVHANGEETGLSPDLFDVVSLAYVVITVMLNSCMVS